MKEVTGIGLVETTDVEPAWLCFLTTDEHMRAAFQDELRQHKRDSWQSTGRVPATVRILSAPTVLLGRVLANFAYPKFLAIDMELMQLQRREVLWGSFIRSTIQDEALRSEELTRVKSQTDQAWKSIWARRPMW